MKHFVRVLSLAGFVGLLSSFALAGHYTTGTTSGVTFTASPGGGSPVFGYGTVTGEVGGGGGNCSIGGTASTTFTWSEDYSGEPPPSQVIIIEHCKLWTDAKTYPYSAPAGGGSADSGLGSTWKNYSDPTPTGIGVPPYGKDHTVTCDAYKAHIVSGSTSITVNTCSPSASASSYNGSYSADIDYSVAVYPLSVSVSGTVTVSHNLEILPGQLATASLSSTAPGISAVTGTWNWTGPIDNSFSDFPGTSTSGEVVDVDSSEWHSASPSWRYITDEANTVNCAVELQYQPTGFSAASVGTTSVDRVVNVIAVPCTMTGTYEAYGQLIVGSPINLTSEPSGGGNAMDMSYSATTPGEFVSGGDYGQICMVQLLRGPTTYNLNDVAVKTSFANGDDRGNDRGSSSSTDMVYPYCDGYVTANINHTGTGYDTPAMGFYDDPILNSASVNLTARDYGMYFAPGNSKAVALKYREWTWNAAASKSGSTWSLGSNHTIEVTVEKALLHPFWNHACTNF